MEEKPIIKATGQYYGGHILHPCSKNGDYVNIEVFQDKIIFTKIGFLGKKWSVEIPISKIIFKDISLGMEKLASTYETISSVYALGGLGLKDKANILTIPYKDEKGIIQKPRFSFKNKILEKISKFIYDKMPSK